MLCQHAYHTLEDFEFPAGIQLFSSLFENIFLPVVFGAYTKFEDPSLCWRFLLPNNTDTCFVPASDTVPFVFSIAHKSDVLLSFFL